MILTDLLRDNFYPSQEQLDNCKKLIVVVNAFEDYMGLKFECTSGLRSIEAHKAIYDKLRAQDKAEGKSPRTIPMFSAHLTGHAVDFICPSFSIIDLQGIFLSDEILELAEKIGAYFEDFKYTCGNNGVGGWIHCQNIPPHSGKRFFIP